MIPARSLSRLPACAFLLGALIAAAPALRAQEPKEDNAPWKLSAAVGPAFALGKAGERWAKLIAAQSGETIAVQFSPGATLASRDPAREFVALRDGGADLAVGSSLYWSAQVVELNMIGLPWLAPEDKDLASVASDAMAQRLFAAVARAGAVPLALAPLGHRVLASTGKLLRTPEDLAGMKVRSTSLPFLTDFFVGMGAEPRAMSFADAQAALLAGMLDAQDGTLATIAAARLDRIGIKQVMLWGAVAEIAVFAANQAAWNAWTDEQRAIARDTAQQAARELPTLARDENSAALVALRKRGVTVTRLTATGRAAFAAAARGVYDKWAAVAGPDLVREAEMAIKGPPP